MPFDTSATDIEWWCLFEKNLVPKVGICITKTHREKSKIIDKNKVNFGCEVLNRTRKEYIFSSFKHL